MTRLGLTATPIYNYFVASSVDNTLTAQPGNLLIEGTSAELNGIDQENVNHLLQYDNLTTLQQHVIDAWNNGASTVAQDESETTSADDKNTLQEFCQPLLHYYEDSGDKNWYDILKVLVDEAMSNVVDQDGTYFGWLDSGAPAPGSFYLNEIQWCHFVAEYCLITFQDRWNHLSAAEKSQAETHLTWMNTNIVDKWFDNYGIRASIVNQIAGFTSTPPGQEWLDRWTMTTAFCLLLEKAWQVRGLTGSTNVGTAGQDLLDAFVDTTSPHQDGRLLWNTTPWDTELAGVDTGEYKGYDVGHAAREARVYPMLQSRGFTTRDFQYEMSKTWLKLWSGKFSNVDGYGEGQGFWVDNFVSEEKQDTTYEGILFNATYGGGMSGGLGYLGWPYLARFNSQVYWSILAWHHLLRQASGSPRNAIEQRSNTEQGRLSIACYAACGKIRQQWTYSPPTTEVKTKLTIDHTKIAKQKTTDDMIGEWLSGSFDGINMPFSDNSLSHNNVATSTGLDVDDIVGGPDGKNGVLMDSTSKWVDITESDTALELTGDLTICGYVFWENQTSNAAVAGKWANTSGYMLYANGADLRAYRDGNFAEFVGGTPATGKWNFVAVVWEGTNAHLHKWNVDDGWTKSTIAIGASTQSVASGAFEIGTYGDAAGAKLHARFNRIRIYDRALSDAEVQEVGSYKNNQMVATKEDGFPEPILRFEFEDNANDKMFGNDGTEVGSPTYVNGYRGKAIQFNGTTQYVAVTTDEPDLPIQGQISLYARVYLDTTFLSGDRAIIGRGKDDQILLFYEAPNLVLRVDGIGSDLVYDISMVQEGFHSFVATVNGTTGKLFVDGIERSTGIVNAIPLGLGVEWTIGQFNPVTPGFYGIGLYDEVAIFDISLTQSQTMALHRFGQKRRNENNCVYLTGDMFLSDHEIWSIPRTDGSDIRVLADIEGTQQLPLHIIEYDQGINSLFMVLRLDETIDGTYGAIDEDVDLWLSLGDGIKSMESVGELNGQNNVYTAKAVYHLQDEGVDSSINRFDGVENGAPTYLDGVLGQSLNADGVDDYIENTGIDLTQYPFSISVLIKTPSSPDGVIFWVGDNTDDQHFVSLRVLGSGLVRLEIDSGVTSTALTTSTTVVDDGQWHNITGVLESDSSRKIFVDGVEENESTNTRVLPTVNSIALARYNDVTPSNFFTGEIDIAILTSHALTADQVLTDSNKSLSPQTFLTAEQNVTLVAQSGSIAIAGTNAALGLNGIMAQPGSVIIVGTSAVLGTFISTQNADFSFGVGVGIGL